MKKAIRKIILVVSIIGAGALINTSLAQPRPGDPGVGGGSGGSGPIGGSAPVGSGLVMLLAMGFGYGAKKVYDARKASLNE